MTTARLTQQTVEVLQKGDAAARLTQQSAEVLTNGTPAARLTQLVVEVLFSCNPKARLTQLVVEVLTDAPAGTDYDEDADNTLSLSDLASVDATFSRLVTDTFSITSHARLQGEVSAENTFDMDSDVTASSTFNRTVPQTITFVSLAVENGDFERTLEDTIVFTDMAVKTIVADAEDLFEPDDEVDFLKYVHRTVSQTLTITPTITRSLSLSRSANQGFVPTHLATRTIQRNRIVSQSLTLAQQAIGIQSVVAPNTLVLMQDATEDVGKHVHQALEITQQALEETTFNRALFSVMHPGQVITCQKTYRRTLSQTITFGQLVVGYNVKPTHNTITFSQLAVGVQSKAASNTLVFTQAATYNRTKAISVAKTFIISSSATVVKSYGRTGHNAFGFSQFAKGTRVLSRTVNQSFTMTQDVVGQRFLRAVEQTFVISQDADVQRLLSVSTSDLLVMTDATVVSTTLSFDIEQTLVFLPSYQKPIGNGMFVSVPNAQGVKVRKLVTLVSDTHAITLPSPEFNDRIGDNAKLNIKRSMDGERYIYKTGTDASRLVYDFVLDRVKAIELRAFLLPNNSKLLQMENWKGEIWMVNLTNNPFSTIEEARWESGNKCRISLEFEGARLN